MTQNKPRNKNEWSNFWTGRFKRTHLSIKSKRYGTEILCRSNADGGSMGFHHTSDPKEVTCKTCKKMIRKKKHI